MSDTKSPVDIVASPFANSSLGVSPFLARIDPSDDTLYTPADTVPPTAAPKAAAAPISPITSISGSNNDRCDSVYALAIPSSSPSVIPSFTVIVAPSDNRLVNSSNSPLNSTGGLPFINNFSSAIPPDAAEATASTPATLPELIAKSKEYTLAFPS